MPNLCNTEQGLQILEPLEFLSALFSVHLPQTTTWCMLSSSFFFFFGFRIYVREQDVHDTSSRAVTHPARPQAKYLSPDQLDIGLPTNPAHAFERHQNKVIERHPVDAQLPRIMPRAWLGHVRAILLTACIIHSLFVPHRESRTHHEKPSIRLGYLTSQLSESDRTAPIRCGESVLPSRIPGPLRKGPHMSS